MPKNHVEIEGQVKWEPKVFAPREQGQKPITVFAIELRSSKSPSTSVFHCKAYGDVSEALGQENLSQGDTVLVTGRLNESKWKDKRTDEWMNRIEIWANQVDFVERVGDGQSAAGEFVAVSTPPADDDIPF